MGSRTEKLLLEDAQELGYVGIKTDMGGHGGYKTGSDAGDLLIGRRVQAIPDDPELYESKEAYHDPSHYEVDIYSQLLIIEEKYKSNESNKYLQEDGDKFDAMIEFAEAIGAKPTLACRWSTNLEWSPGPTHYLIDAREVERTPSGNVSVKPETAEEKFTPTEEFFG